MYASSGLLIGTLTKHLIIDQIMANDAKRQKLQPNLDLNDETSVPEIQDSEVTDRKLRTFLKWCGDLKFDINKKVTVSRLGSCNHYGMVAMDDIIEGETLFSVPRDALLHPSNCSISSLLQQGKCDLASESGWVPLLLCLMSEYTEVDSRWRPYLDICPDDTQIDSPMFWDREMVTRELQGTGILSLIERDTTSVQHEYQTVALPFMKKNPQHFDLSIHTLELYRKMVAFAMAYSFTEPQKSSRRLQRSREDDDKESEYDDSDDDSDSDSDDGDSTEASIPMMVPMADILNHIAKNNARLQFGETSLKMIATKNIQKNEEVFNTYGELANWQLLHMYGFAEPYPENIFDTVDLPMSLVRDQSLTCLDGDTAFIQLKWDFIDDNSSEFPDSIVIGCDGIMNKYEVYDIIKTINMSPTEFEKHQTFIDDEEEEEDEDEILQNLDHFFSFYGVSQLPAPWRKLLLSSSVEQMKLYKNTQEEDLKLLNELDDENGKMKQVLHVRVGQRKLLEKLMQNLRTKNGKTLPAS